ncbi:hypothetical protein ES703_123300 [subsurface metagenome]
MLPHDAGLIDGRVEIDEVPESVRRECDVLGKLNDGALVQPAPEGGRVDVVPAGDGVVEPGGDGPVVEGEHDRQPPVPGVGEHLPVDTDRLGVRQRLQLA